MPLVLRMRNMGSRVILVRIAVETLPGSEVVHPKFEVIAAPDEWKAAVDLVSQEQFSERDSLVYTFHERLLPLLRKSTGSFMRVNPSRNPWKSGAVGIRGVSVTYGPRKDSTYVQIWFSKENAPAVNHAGMRVLEAHRDEVEKELHGYVLDWRVNDATAILEVIVDGIGYATAPDQVQMNEIAAVAGKMAELIRRYRIEITKAVSDSAQQSE